MIIVGVSALFHDAACAIVVDGRLVSAAQEERFTRRRFDESMPVYAFAHCLRQAGVSIHDIDCVAYYEEPQKKLERQLWMGLPQVPLASRQTLFRLDATRPFREIRNRLGYEGKVLTVGHHEAHAASAFYCSGVEEAALLTIDGVGEWATTTYGKGDEHGVHVLEEVRFPHSLGLLYATLTTYLGFQVNSDEYKVMGLAPYGQPTYLEKLRNLVEDQPGGQFRLDMKYFDFACTNKMFTPALADLLGIPARGPDDDISALHQNLASSLQLLLEEILLRKLKHLSDLTGSDNVCYAGGVALNCVSNARLMREGPFRNWFIQPAAGDAGSAVGAALWAHHRLTGGFERRRMRDVRLGPEYSDQYLRQMLRQGDAPYADYADRTSDLLSATASRLAQGKVVGWFQGRMEFGPRALGSRSILADPGDERMRDHINAMVKKREAFRPFAPAVVAERCSEFFELDRESPFMLETAQVRKNVSLPAVTHVDGSARVQTVDRDVDPRFHALLTEFGRLTGYPVLLNTSFNMRGEPIVCDPCDALSCFLRASLDVLVVGDIMVERQSIPPDWIQSVSRLTPSRAPAISSDAYTFF
ncbi:MAG: carbamoyltransferase [Bryobacteraceae bacterium]